MRAAILILAALVLAGGGCRGEPTQAAKPVKTDAPKVAWVDDWPQPKCAGDCAVADRLVTAAYNRCSEDSGGVTSALLECMDAEYLRQGKALNATFRRVSGKASPRRRANLAASQAEWLAAAERRADDLGHQYGTGSLGVLMRGEARVRLFAQRRADLERFEAGDLKGPARP